MNIEFFTFLKREIHRFLVLYKQTIVPALISSLLYIIVFGNALGARMGPIDNRTYIQYIIPGLAMMSVINQAYQNSASSIMQGKYLKFIEDILVSPLSGLQISLGYIIGGALRGLICGFGILIICLFLTDFQIDNYILTFLYLLTVSWTFSAFGVIIGIYAKSWDEIGSFTNFIFMPLTFLGGVFYSVDMLPTIEILGREMPIWKNISYLNPIYWMITGLRYATLSVGGKAVMVTSLFICFGFSGIFTMIAAWMFKTGYKIKS